MSSLWENHKKEAPVQGLTGLWGGASGALTGGGSSGFSVFITAGVNGFQGQSNNARVRSSGGNGLRTSANVQGGSGGGVSALWVNNTYTGNPIALVGGGGGSDWQDQGGNGGGVGIDGGTGFDQTAGRGEHGSTRRPIGATQNAGGFYNWANSASSCDGEHGVQLRGGDVTCNDSFGGGAGGGGYWGGGAGTGNDGNGGTPGSGGSGYLDTSNYTTQIVTNTTSAQRAQTYNPNSTVFYSQTNHPGGTYGQGGNRRNGFAGRVLVWDATFSSILHTIDGPASNTEVSLVPGTQYGFELFGGGGAGGSEQSGGGCGGYAKVNITMPA